MTTPTRPTHIDVRSDSQASLQRPLRSPRMHVAGEHPPELSPLDAFALQSRLLAKQLEESAKAGRRMSRLPPLTTESPLIVQGRSEYFRQLSADPMMEEPLSAGHAMRAELEESPDRPQSMHPRMSQIPPTPDASFPLPTPRSFDQMRGRTLGPTDEKSSYFGGRREHSPASFDSVSIDARLADDGQDAQSMHLEIVDESLMAPGQTNLHHKTSHESLNESLAPPKSGFPKRTSSVMSQPIESIEDETMGSSFHSSRKLSTSSAGVFSPFQQRSPSISSNISELPRPAFNFSRPMSRAGTPDPKSSAPSRLDLPLRQPSSDSHTSSFVADDAVNTPISMNSEGFPDITEEGRPGAPSYIYSKFSLPRGKIMQRANSKERGQPGAAFAWEQPMAPGSASNVQTIPFGGQAPPSPPTRPSSSGGLQVDGAGRPSGSLDVPRPTTQPSPSNSRPSTSDERTSEDAPRGRSHNRPATATTSDASTIKARSQISVANTMADTPADEHVNKAIALHEEGKLNESTYHLRYAAKQGHPTGMLLYALACRHGWGMRPNQEEGVRWLRKAADSAGVEIAQDENNNAKGGQHVDRVEQRTRKAQLALSIYELGVSHMNGWGIEQDKALALRCFEIAGSKSHPIVHTKRQGELTGFYFRLGRCGCSCGGWFLLRQGGWLQEEPEEGSQILPHGRSQGNEHGWQQLVSLYPRPLVLPDTHVDWAILLGSTSQNTTRTTKTTRGA